MIELYEYVAQEHATMFGGEPVTVEVTVTSGHASASLDLLLQRALHQHAHAETAKARDPETVARQIHETLTKNSWAVDTVRILRGSGRYVSYRIVRG